MSDEQFSFLRKEMENAIAPIPPHQLDQRYARAYRELCLAVDTLARRGTSTSKEKRTFWKTLGTQLNKLDERLINEFSLSLKRKPL